MSAIFNLPNRWATKRAESSFAICQHRPEPILERFSIPSISPQLHAMCSTFKPSAYKGVGLLRHEVCNMQHVLPPPFNPASKDTTRQMQQLALPQHDRCNRFPFFVLFCDIYTSYVTFGQLPANCFQVVAVGYRGFGFGFVGDAEWCLPAPGEAWQMCI